MALNFDSFFKHLGRLNQILFLLFFAINVYWFYDGWKDKYSEKEPEVAVLDPKDGQFESKLKENLDYVMERKVRDVLVFKIQNTAVAAPPLGGISDDGLQRVVDSVGYGSETSPKTVNLLFVKEDGSSKKLFEKDVFLTAYRFASTREDYEKSPYSAFCSKPLYGYQ